MDIPLLEKVLLAKYNIDQYVEELGTTLGEELLKIHKSYYHTIYSLVQEGLINGISHITGGGILGNTKRIIPNGLTLKVDWNSWEVPPIFRLIQKLGDVPEEEMRTVFNLGIGLILVISKSNVDKVLNFVEGKEKYFIIGEVV